MSCLRLYEKAGQVTSKDGIEVLRIAQTDQLINAKKDFLWREVLLFLGLMDS